MHLLTTTKPTDLGPHGVIPAGRYVVEDMNAAELLVMADRGTATVGPMTQLLPSFDENRDWNDRSVLFMRSGGFGDSLFLVPILREMRIRWPRVRLVVACRQARYEVFTGLAFPDVRADTPVELRHALTYDAVVQFENVIELEPKLHYVDALARSMGLTLPDGPEARRCSYTVSEEERQWAATRYPRTKAKRLALQWSSGQVARSYPAKLNEAVVCELANRDWEIFILGEPGKVRAKTVGPIRNLTDENLNFRQSVAAMATCDVVLGPDSALVHVAGALGLPTVALFGPIDAAQRVAFAPSVLGVQGPAPCTRCGFHGKSTFDLPRNQPCTSAGLCVALANIHPARVVADVEAMAR